MSPIKQILIGSAVGIGLGMLIALFVPHYEYEDLHPDQDRVTKENTIVWKGIIGNQEVIITQKEIENY